MFPVPMNPFSVFPTNIFFPSAFWCVYGFIFIYLFLFVCFTCLPYVVSVSSVLNFSFLGARIWWASLVQLDPPETFKCCLESIIGSWWPFPSIDYFWKRRSWYKSERQTICIYMIHSASPRPVCSRSSSFSGGSFSASLLGSFSLDLKCWCVSGLSSGSLLFSL